jgi:nicotinate-nucleotide pyrophosphorylase (carboxylating)
MFIPRRLVEEKLMQLLAEDVGQGDVTSAAIISANTVVTAEVLAKQAGVVAGLEEAVLLSECLGLEAKAKVADGSKIKNKQVLLELRGNAQTILVAERTMLNLLSRMSGIAT